MPQLIMPWARQAAVHAGAQRGTFSDNDCDMVVVTMTLTMMMSMMMATTIPMQMLAVI